MAKKPIPEELDVLIKEYLTDGVLTDKERKVILDEAEALGLNRAKIDLYLDAQVQKIDQATDAAVRRKKGKECPFCGAPVPQLAEKCPACGQFITPEASKELTEILENLETALTNFKTGKEINKSKAIVEQYIRKANLYYENNPKVQKLLTQINEEFKRTNRLALLEKIKHILLWVIPLLIVVFFYVKCRNSSPEVISENVIELVQENKLTKAKTIVTSSKVSQGSGDSVYGFVEDFDAMFLALIKAYVKTGDYENAETVALAYRSKINYEYCWKKTPTYQYLKSLYDREGRDFSTLRSID